MSISFGSRRRSLAQVDLRRPLTDHPLNENRSVWWLALPRLYGGAYWYDLVAGISAKLSGQSAGYGFSPLSYPGGAGSLRGDGANTKADAPYGSVPSTSSISMAAWIFSSANQNAYTSIFETRKTTAGLLGLLVSGTGTNLLTACFANDYYGLNTGLAIPNNQWMLAGFTFKVGTGMSIYLGNPATGQLSSYSFASGSGAQTFSAGPTFWNVGYDANVSGRTWNGYLNDCSVWFGRVLTANDFATMLRLPIAGYPGVLRRRPVPNYGAAASPPSSTVYRKTFSSLGTRTGSRQAQRILGGL